MQSVQDQEARNRIAGIHNNTNLAEPGEHELPQTTTCAEPPLDNPRAGSEETEALQATAEGLEMIETRPKPETPSDMAVEQSEDAEAEAVAAPGIDESNMVSCNISERPA